MRILLIVCIIVAISGNSFAQRYARLNGAWTAAIWASTPGGIAGSAATPTATDDAYTNGFLVTVAANATCRNLNITYNLANSLSLSSLRILTVTGTLNGYDDAGAIEQIPTAAILSFASGSSIVFTAANIQPAYDPYIIFFWDNTVPLGRVTFNLGGLSKNIIIPLSISAIARLQSGTLTADTGADLNGNSTATFQIDAGATFNTNDPLTNFNNFQITGTLQTSSTVSASGGAGSLTVNSGGLLTSTGSSGTISSSSTTISGTINTSNALNTTGTFQLNSTGILNTSFSGVNQTEGWWSLSNRPSSATLDPAGTINFSGGSQNIYARSYPNLTLSGSGTKTVVGSGSINIAGNLLFSSSSIILSSAFSTIFDGSGAQSISGGGTANFNGGLQVNKSAGTLTLSQNISVQSGLTLTSGTIDFGSNTINLSGNLVNNAILTPSASILNITGVTSVSGSSTTSLNSLTISGSGTFTAPATLNIGGDFTNNGSFNASTGVIVLNGVAAQSIGGSVASTFNSIQINKSSGTATIAAPQNITNTLTMSAGTLAAGGNLTLVSNSSGDARIAQITGGSITGNVIVQRYLPNTSVVKAYRYLASPVTGAFISDWKLEFPITGTFNDPSTQAEWPAITGISQASPSMFIYNEAHVPTTTIDDRFESYPINGTSSTASAITNGKGYAAFVRQIAPITLDLTGAPKQGAAGVSVTAQSGGGNDGWNLIGNPYAAPINWDNVTRPGGVNASISLKDNTNNLGNGAGNYAVWVQGGLPGSGIPASYTGTIASGQAFWINTTVTTTITFKEADKQAISNPTFIRQGSLEDIVRVHLNGNGRKDEAVIRFSDNAKDGADSNFDAFKLKNTFINLSSFSSDSLKMAINVLGSLPCQKEVGLFIDGVTPGSYEISFSQFETFGGSVNMSLFDKFLDQHIDIRKVASYGFTITGDKGSYEKRFRISFVDQVDTNLTKVPNNACSGNDATVLLKNSQSSVTYFATDLTGKIVSNNFIGNGGDLVISIAKDYLIDGQNNFTIKAKSSSCDAKTLSGNVTLTVENLPIATSTAGDRCNSGQVVLSASGAPLKGSYNWYDAINALEPVVGNGTATFTTPLLIKTKTYYVSSVNSLGCEGLRTPVVATVNFPTEIASVAGANHCKAGSVTLEAAGGTNGQYRWYESATATNSISGQINSKLITPTLPETRTYYVSLINEKGCEGQRLPVVASITTYEDATITVEESKLISNAATGNQWYVNGKAILGATEKTYEATESGLYTLEVKVGDCTTSAGREMLVTGLGNLSDSGIKIYPNPVLNKVTVEVNSTNTVAVEIVNALGMKVTGEELKRQVNGVSRSEFDLSTESAGIYLIKIMDGKTIHTSKIIKK